MVVIKVLYNGEILKSRSYTGLVKKLALGGLTPKDNIHQYIEEVAHRVSIQFGVNSHSISRNPKGFIKSLALLGVLEEIR